MNHKNQAWFQRGFYNVLTALALCLVTSTARSASPNIDWVHHAYTYPGTLNCQEMAVDGAGNIFVTGQNEGTTYFGTNLLTSFWTDGYVAKLDVTGKPLWARSFFDSSFTEDDESRAIAVDLAGNCYATGSSYASRDIVTLKYDPAGNLIWRQTLGGDHGINNPSGIAVDESDNFYLAGNISHTVDFGGTSLSANSKRIPFLAKYDASTNLLWVIQLGSTNTTVGRIRLDGKGHLYANGSFTTNASFGGISLNGVPGITSSFLVKMDLSGNVIWLRTTTGGISFGLDGMENSYMAGTFSSSLILDTGNGTTNLNSNGDLDVFLSKYDAAGNLLWVTSFGGSGRDIIGGIAADQTGNVYLAGSFPSTNLTLGSITLPGKTAEDASTLFSAKFSPLGQVLWARELKNGTQTSQDSVIAYGMVVDTHQQCYVGARFNGVFYKIGNLFMTNYSGRDFFMTKLVDRPSLNIVSAAGQSQVSWATNWPGYVLESSSNLIGGTWSTVSNAPAVNGENNVVTLQDPVAPQFFRLRTP